MTRRSSPGGRAEQLGGAPARVGVGEAVEAVAAQRQSALAPRRRAGRRSGAPRAGRRGRRCRSRRRWAGPARSRVERPHRRAPPAGCAAAPGRRAVRARASTAGSTQRRPVELGAAVDDPVGGGVGRGPGVEDRRAAPSREPSVVAAGSRRRARQDLVAGAEQPQLQARGARVDGEDRAGAATRSVLIPRSSRGPPACPRGARARRRGGASSISSAVRLQRRRRRRAPGATGAAPRAPGGSGSSRLSTTMSNGVVVVPCSLKPRTWKRLGSGRPCSSWWSGAGVAVEGEDHVGRRC